MLVNTAELREVSAAERQAAETFETLRVALSDVDCDESLGERLDTRLAERQIVFCGEHGKSDVVVGGRFARFTNHRCQWCNGEAMTFDEIRAFLDRRAKETAA